LRRSEARAVSDSVSYAGCPGEKKYEKFSGSDENGKAFKMEERPVKKTRERSP